MQSAITANLAVLLALSGLFIVFDQPAQAQTQAETETGEFLESAVFGIGLQATGSACWISMRQSSDQGRGLELTFMADRLLMLGLRGISKFADTDVLDPYTGAGINLILGPRLSQGIPFTSLQFLLGLEVELPFLPPPFAINFEAALEFELDQEFYSYVGGGLHFHF